MTVEEIIEETVKRVLANEARPIVEQLLGETLATMAGVLRERGPHAAPEAAGTVAVVSPEVVSARQSLEEPQRRRRIKLDRLENSAGTVSFVAAAKVLGIDRTTIYGLVKRGKLVAAGKRKLPRGRTAVLFVTKESLEAEVARRGLQKTKTPWSKPEMTYKQAADYLGVLPSTICSRVYEGKIERVGKKGDVPALVKTESVLKFAQTRRRWKTR